MERPRSPRMMWTSLSSPFAAAAAAYIAKLEASLDRSIDVRAALAILLINVAKTRDDGGFFLH